MKNCKKAHFLPYFISLSEHFPNAKTSVLQEVIARYISRKRSWHQIVNLPKYDRKYGHQFSIDFLLNILLKIYDSV